MAQNYWYYVIHVIIDITYLRIYKYRTYVYVYTIIYTYMYT